MAKRMLIDATHPEETRVVVLNGHRLEEFDFESSTKQHVKGNIYLAKVTRVEPSLQAAFVEYGGNRHGFLAFSEIHSDYYRIPVGDRDADGTARWPGAAATEDGGEPAEEAGVPLEAALPEVVPVAAASENPGGIESEIEPPLSSLAGQPDQAPGPPFEGDEGGPAPATSRPSEPIMWMASDAGLGDSFPAAALPEPPAPGMEAAAAGEAPQGADEMAAALDWVMPGPPMAEAHPTAEGEAGEADAVETLGGDEFDEAERQRSRTPRQYKIQEVVKRRQIMLVQVIKEERGNKGAALTTYLSLAGRYCVLMPNTARGGGVSRKITSLSDRRRLKEILEDLDIPEGMGVIVRTAGAERSKAEIKRDYEYLLRLWNEIRDLTLRSSAPALIYEEGNLIKRSIRDLYTRDIDEVLVEGEEGYRTAKSFMKMLMPSHAKRVQPYRDTQCGLLHRFQVESQIDAIHSPIVQLRSGGYVVINQTEALVAIDVNSGRSTRERNIEETALRTNLEAAEEIARQLRLRDLAGLIVIDLIDMEEHRNQAAVERRFKDALKNDRARIQVGRISPFGLLEMSRQRLRPSLVEASTQPCPHCGGTGFIRSTESTALYVLRSIEEEGMRHRSAEICVYVPTTVALYILNQKRESLAQVEQRYGLHVLVARDDSLIPPAFRLERLRAYGPVDAATVPAPLTQSAAEETQPEIEDAADATEDEPDERPAAEARRGHGRRRRRRRRREDEPSRRLGGFGETGSAAAIDTAAELAGAEPAQGEDRQDEEADADRHRRRRGRRGGRRRPRRGEPGEAGFDETRPAAATVEIVPQSGPDPVDFEAGEAAGADPFTAPAREPADAVFEPADAGGVDAIEAASLPAFAGDPEGGFAAAAAIGEIRERSLGEPAIGGGAVFPSSPEAPEIAGDEQSGEPASHEAVPEPALAPATAESSGAEVQTVTEKPVNPRRGWWQRLIQP